jgi:small-conductance mechanosensitive channel
MRRSLIAAAATVCVGYVAWRFLYQWTEEQVRAPMPVAGEGGAQAASRLTTVLPMLRILAAAAIVVVTVLLALSQLGVQIAPLLAGAGVVGLAISFGAQTLVKDIITGAFFLVDDAFRVGEYIVSGSYKGQVEAISLRSVKLRHHRGSVYTVPFGELRAIQNMSRDWVIDKFSIGITYDSDIEKARKLIKKVGQALAADPEHAPHILEPLKMQGVEQFGDFAVELRVKMKTRPGEQFVIRRKANAMIKRAFDENGIRFAFPTVQVAGGAGGDGATAAAQQGLALVRPPAATTP